VGRDKGDNGDKDNSQQSTIVMLFDRSIANLPSFG
jgi:hypothetical protein